MIDLFFPPKPPEPENARLVLGVDANAKVEPDDLPKTRSYRGRKLKPNCPRGHPYSEGKMLADGTMKRWCKVCKNASRRNKK